MEASPAPPQTLYPVSSPFTPNDGSANQSEALVACGTPASAQSEPEESEESARKKHFTALRQVVCFKEMEMGELSEPSPALEESLGATVRALFRSESARRDEEAAELRSELAKARDKAAELGAKVEQLNAQVLERRAMDTDSHVRAMDTLNAVQRASDLERELIERQHAEKMKNTASSWPAFGSENLNVIFSEDLDFLSQRSSCYPPSGI